MQTRGLGSLSVLSKLNLAAAALALVLGTLLALAFVQARQLESERAVAAAMTAAMRNNIEADMMHDAMRSTVLAARVAALTGDRAALAAAESDLADYRGFLARLNQSNAALAFDAETSAQVAAVRDSFTAYEGEVEAVVAAARLGPDQVAARMPAFTTMFETMEVNNAKVSDHIDAQVRAASQAVADRAARLQQVLATLAVLVLGLVGAFILYVRRSIVAPVVAVAHSLETGEAGNLAAQELRGDELGQLARSVAAFRAAADAAREAEAVRAAAERERAEMAEAEMRRRDTLMAATQQLQGRVGAISSHLASTTAQLTAVAGSLAANADQSRSEAKQAVGSVDQNLSAVVAIAEATDEVLVSINEISQGVGTAARSTGDVRKLSDAAKRAMDELGDTTSKVGRVSVLIGDIAARTRMLALNATIEATHAGEAGRSFAVVAQEVKQLAQQTASAVGEIEALVASMTGTTQGAAQSIGSVWSAIEDLNKVTTAIASAAEQQGSAASEIGRTIHVTSQESQAVRHGLTPMGAQVEQTAVSAQEVLDAARSLDRQAADLQAEIEAYAKSAVAA